jgi:hypothetical protein
MADLNKLRHRFGIASLLLATAIVVVAFTVPAGQNKFVITTVKTTSSALSALSMNFWTQP